ncbi:hypothetical protein ACOME3_006649 [Neoechinorhynchus agilis]
MTSSFIMNLRSRSSHQSSLIDCLQNRDIYESDEELSRRMRVITDLYVLFNKWIQELAFERQITLAHIKGALFTFGSFKLGVHAKRGDIDVLFVGPEHIDRRDFFVGFVQVLKEQPSVRRLCSVEEAFVPVVKLDFCGIAIDAIFARMKVPTIPTDLDLTDNSVLRDLDQRCARSLNGVRVAKELITTIPNHEQFRHALSAIKLWAKKRGICSNVLGYFGGVTWALMMTLVAKMNPSSNASDLLYHFFEIFANWNWPEPVVLKKIEDVGLGYEVQISSSGPFYDLLRL